MNLNKVLLMIGLLTFLGLLSPTIFADIQTKLSDPMMRTFAQSTMLIMFGCFAVGLVYWMGEEKN